MLSWRDVEERQMEHAQRIRRVEQMYLMRAELASSGNADRWQWRLMSQLGKWLVMTGSRLQAHVEAARPAAPAPPLAMGTNAHSTQPRR